MWYVLDDIMSKCFQLKNVSDQEMIQIHKKAIVLLQNLKASEENPEEITMDMAVVLAIFAILNPDNLPIKDEDMEFLCLSYHKFMDRYSALN